MLATFAVSVGMLAVANLEMIWQARHLDDKSESSETLYAKKGHKRTKLPIDVPSENYKPLQSALSQSLEQDELKDENPFAHLANLDPLRQVMQRGVAKFHRETFRSPDYQDESGYDLLSYEITHTDGGKSTILAYLEKTDATIWRNVGAPDQRTVFVVFYVSSGDKMLYSYFRGGDLIEQAEVSSADAGTQVAKRLSQGVPFLSVSR
jgi:hypothetical protein